jgi:EmrB/QacA subfamily drug resistance transporter
VDTSADFTQHSRRRLILAVLCLSVVLVVMANMALNVALPALGRHLQANGTALQWVVDSYVLCFAGLLLPAGAAGDRLGRKGCLQAGLTVFAVASALGAFAGSTGELITARAVMGAGAALVMPSTLALLAAVFPPAERPAAIAVWAAVAGGSVAVSITWSGFMLERFWWGSVFLGMAAVAVAALLAGAVLLPAPAVHPRARLDPAGAVLSAAGITGVLYGLIEAPDGGWLSLRALVPFGAGLLVLLVFAAWERRAAHPMLPRLAAARAPAAASLAIGAAYFALFGTYFGLTQYFQLVRGYSPLQAGLCALPAGLAQLAIAPASRLLTARYGLRRVLPTALIASAAGLLMLTTSGVSSSPVLFEAGLGLLGAGMGLTMPPATGVIMAALPGPKAGIGSAINDLVRELGGALGVAVLGSLSLARYRSALSASAGAASAHHSAAQQGLAAAITAARGPAAALAARSAYCSGLAAAMVAGAIVVAGIAGLVAARLPRTSLVPPASPAPRDPGCSPPRQTSPARTEKAARLRAFRAS